MDYTINDAFHDGFECGLLYVIRYFEESPRHGFTNKDAAALAEHLESKKPWKSEEEWYDLLRRKDVKTMTSILAKFPG